MAVIYSAHQTSLNEKTKIDGTVLEALPDTKFKIKLDDGREILAYLAGKMRMNYIKVMLGDRVTVEIGPDENRGRIVYRK
ncbi:MAG: translation initiation factor IF-1 [Candidatus Yanofskybacteria bacterium]|nr:translation initiation factor IF-1 [Candidatus Yanofskybacteria bacterium]